PWLCRCPAPPQRLCILLPYQSLPFSVLPRRPARSPPWPWFFSVLSCRMPSPPAHGGRGTCALGHHGAHAPQAQRVAPAVTQVGRLQRIHPPAVLRRHLRERAREALGALH